MEAGMDFLSTAQKELQEELGLSVGVSDLELAFIQRFSGISEFDGEIFNDQEINQIYVLKKDLDISKLHLQLEELSEVVWMDADEIVKRLEDNDKEICLNQKEYSKVLNIIKNKSREDVNKRIINLRTREDEVR